MRKHSMNEDIKRYDVYILRKSGILQPAPWIKSTDDYDHYTHQAHHFIPKQHYEKNKKWYKERGVRQIIIVLPIPIHEQLHGQAIKNLTANEFKARYGISKWALIFNRKYSEYL